MSRSPLSAPGPPPGTKFGALQHRDYRRYFALVLLSATADNIEHVISYRVIFQAFHSPMLAGFQHLDARALRGQRSDEVLDALIGVQWSLTFSSAAVVPVALGLLAVEARARPRLSV